jgi:beta-N-acetylhexosaminidase
VAKGAAIDTMVRSLFLPMAIFLLLLLAPYEGGALSFYDDAPAEELALELSEAMSPSELVGQLFLLGYFGTPSPEIAEWVSDYGLGGIKIFGWNTGDLQELGSTIGTLQKYASQGRFSIPLFVATDQEGGWVRHVKGETSITPGNLALGASGLPWDSYRTGYYIGRELRVLGINMNFAPTVDVYTHPDADVIGPRAFSSDPVKTAQLSVAYFRGMEEAGIICTAKHFPGHGAATEDSHGTLPQIHADLETIWNRELVPYRFLTKAGIPAVMSGHIAYPVITGDVVAASLSDILLRDLLRERVGFEGLIITDDMQMNGAEVLGGIVEASQLAIRAGNDVLMVSRDNETYHTIRGRLLREMEEDPLFRDYVQEAVRRIVLVKLRYLKGASRVPLYPDPEEIRNYIPDPEGKKFFLDQAHRSVSLIRGTGSAITSSDSERVLLAGQLRLFLELGKNYFPEADTYYFPYSPFFTSDPAIAKELLDMASSYDRIIFCLANPNSAQVLDSLKELEKKVHVISVLTPVYLESLPWVKHALAVYGTGRDSLEAGFSALIGAFEPSGGIPFFFESHQREP